ncbi:MAG: elongation factor G [Bacteroidales bacterium]|nr:elongation factor G [Bacteroidales bacterium]
MKVYTTNELRNIALIGGAKSGKTILSESMLFEGGVISRRGTIEDKNTLSDYKEIELDKQNSVSSTVLYAEYQGKKINFIDTPGFADYIGEVVTALNIADTALMVVNSHNGVEVGTEISWKQAEKLNKPVVFVANQMDHEKVNFDDTYNQLKEYFGDKVILAQYPVNAGPEFDTVIDLVQMKMLKFPVGGGKTEVAEIPDSEKDKAEELHAALVEAAAEGSEELMEKYFENEGLEKTEIQKGIKLGVLSRSLFPVFCTSAKQNQGVGRLLEFIIASIPAPNEVPGRKNSEGKEVTCNADDQTALFIFKTSIEPHLGEVCFFKVFAGEITEGMDLINSDTGNKERISQLFIIAGKNREKVEKAVAGDIAATIKLKDSKNNITLNSLKNPDLKIEKIVYPEPVYFTAIKAVNSSDDEKLGVALNEIHKTDPTILIEYSRELKQMIISGQGELHINTLKWILDNVYKIETTFSTPKIPYRETITKSARANYRHKKQSGGSGQFGEVHLMIQPYSENMPKPTDFPIRHTDTYDLDWGGKLVFNNCIVGGAIDARFMPAIYKGVMERMEEGPLTGSYARDISVYIYDGKMHPVDSNEISFKLAGRHAFSTAFKNAGPKIMEPIYNVEVLVPEEMMGNVMTDLQGRRAIIMGMEGEGKYQRIKARVPLAEMNRYSTALSSLSSGRATFSMKFEEYAQVPNDVQVQLLKAYEEAQKEED